MRTPIKYYGGKQNIADKIISLIPDHYCYCEPFFGGGAVFFKKEPSQVEIINDKNDALITFYSVVKNKYKELYKRVQGTLYSESTFNKCKEKYEANKYDDDIDKAYCIWYLSIASFSGKIGGYFSVCVNRTTTNINILNKKKKYFFLKK